MKFAFMGEPDHDLALPFQDLCKCIHSSLLVSARLERSHYSESDFS